MYIHKIKVNKYDVSPSRLSIGTEGSQGVEAIQFELSEEWAGLTYNVTFQPLGGQGVSIIYTGDPILIPPEATAKAGYCQMIIDGVAGTKIIKSKTIDLIIVDTIDRAITPAPEPTPDTYSQIIDMMNKQAVDAEDAEAAQLEAEIAMGQTFLFRNETEDFKVAASEAADTATQQANRAEMEANEAEESKEDAATAKTEAQQALGDLLAILGQPGGFATLDTDGKLTASQIPYIALSNVVDVDNVAAMLALTSEQVQPGDVVRILTDGEVVATYVLVSPDPSKLESWKELRVGYAAEAGHAQTANTSSNSEKINNKRIINMTQSQYESAVLAEDTYYFVIPDEV